jgi:hypothetical protein
LLLYLNKFLANLSPMSDQQTKDFVQDWLKGLGATFFEEAAGPTQ